MKRTSLLALAIVALTAVACDPPRPRASQTTTTSGTTPSDTGTNTGTTTTTGTGGSNDDGTSAAAISDTTGAITSPKTDPTASDFGRGAGSLGGGSRVETGTQNIGVGHRGALDKDSMNPKR